MTINGLSLLEMQTVDDSMIIGISLDGVRVSSREMCGDETKVGIIIIKADGYGAFIARHTPQASLSIVRMSCRDWYQFGRISPTLWVEASTLRMTPINSAFTATSRAVPTSCTQTSVSHCRGL